jgi:hypothetical protein
MFRIFYAEKDATLYESAPDVNTGLMKFRNWQTIRYRWNNPY